MRHLPVVFQESPDPGMGYTQGCPERGSGAKFGCLAKFIWLLCVLFCVMHFGSERLKEYNASTLKG